MALNQDLPVPTLAEAEKRSFSKEELQYIRGQRPRAVIGLAGDLQGKNCWASRRNFPPTN